MSRFMQRYEKKMVGHSDVQTAILRVLSIPRTLLSQEPHTLSVFLNTV